MKAHGGFVSREDLASYRTVERSPVRADYRGWEILGPPPPAASGVHIAQMLNILEGYDIAAMAFGSAATIHHLAEVLKIAFAARAGQAHHHLDVACHGAARWQAGLCARAAGWKEDFSKRVAGAA